MEPAILEPIPADLPQGFTPITLVQASLRTRGFSIRDIARLTGQNTLTVTQNLSIPQVRSWMAIQLHNLREKGSSEVFNNTVPGNIMTMLDIRDDPAVPAKTRLAAAEALNDRALGKPLSKVENKNLNLHLKGNLVELQQRLSSLQQERNQLIGTPPSPPPQPANVIEE